MKPITLTVEIDPDGGSRSGGGGPPMVLLMPEGSFKTADGNRGYLPGSVCVDIRDEGLFVRTSREDAGRPIEVEQWYPCRGAKVRVSRGAGAAPEPSIVRKNSLAAEIQITSPQAGGPVQQSYVLELADGQSWVVGREGADVNIHLLDEYVSRKHLAIRAKNGRHYAEDLKSSGGTTLNGQKLPPNSPRPLKHGDELALGESGTTTIRYVDMLQVINQEAFPAPPAAPAPPKAAPPTATQPDPGAVPPPPAGAPGASSAGGVRPLVRHYALAWSLTLAVVAVVAYLSWVMLSAG